MIIPTLTTKRLILRGPEPQDFEPLVEFYADAKRCVGFGGPLNRDDAWRWFALSVGHWALRGYGYFTLVAKDTDEICGIVGIWSPEGWDEPEIGWVMFAAAEGKGYAYEAAGRVLDYAYDDLGFTTMTSNIVPGNDRSVALAERLGAKFERFFDSAHMGKDRTYRHPGPATRVWRDANV